MIGQSWNHLLFAHWPLGAEDARRIVPPPLEPDLYDGQGFVGVVPFRMETVRFAWCPPVVGTSSFAELNVRTYVTLDGKPGVFFFSLDVGNLVALEIGRRGFGLPYYRGDVSLETRRRAGELSRPPPRPPRRPSPPSTARRGRRAPRGPARWSTG